MALLTERDRTYKTPEDIVAHVGDEYEKYEGAIVPPLFQNSLFVHPTEANGMTSSEFDYSRMSNPTLDIAERKIAALEGGDGALCFSTGMAAIGAAIIHFVKSDSHIVMVNTVYGGATGAANYVKRKFGVETTFVDGRDLDEIRNAIRPNTTLIYVESPSSLVFRMQDIAEIAKMAKERGITTMMDNTYSTPILQQPLKHGIDVVVHSVTKYMGGHSDLMGGAIVSNSNIITAIRNEERAILCGTMDPHQAWLLTRGLRTLPTRLKQHAANAAKVVEFLENHPKVEKVYYPGSKTYEQPELFEKYMTGTNGLMSLVPKGSAEEAKKFVGRLHFFQNGCSWGGFESLALYLGGPVDKLVRIHIGLENPDTLIADLDQALNQIEE
ncbi:MAG: aminotransferase class I/II-fold pyridoxal phosphate-dependent enzyme [Clostridia bacterium]|nr:aminotransferase class I/II-fold pyridoxal phosphate-dependent enzyme [Clostridia bacterium]